MRLINTDTLEQKEIFETELPEHKYAILSHTWREGEVTLKLFEADTTHKVRGWRKLLDFCRIAKEARLEWAWCDTCCIDKTSSAELSEAINSMYRWYEQAEVCFAYLDDYDLSSGGSPLSLYRWWSRGWTLQELLAPRRVHFFDTNWTLFGTREALSTQIASVTGIPSPYLLGKIPVHSACVSQRMYWASQRRTTRSEDEAYCLLGLFNVNMPLIYGEGSRKAFIRLQRQILLGPRDDTLFAWNPCDATQLRGMFAKSPKEFAHSHDVLLGGLSSIQSLVVNEQGVVLTYIGWMWTIFGIQDECSMVTTTRRLPEFLNPSYVLVRLDCKLATNAELYVAFRRYCGFWYRMGNVMRTKSLRLRWVFEMPLCVMTPFDPNSNKITAALDVPALVSSSALMHEGRKRTGLNSDSVRLLWMYLSYEFVRGVTLWYALRGPKDADDDRSVHAANGRVALCHVILACFWHGRLHAGMSTLTILAVIALLGGLPQDRDYGLSLLITAVPCFTLGRGL